MIITESQADDIAVSANRLIEALDRHCLKNPGLLIAQAMPAIVQVACTEDAP